MKQKQPCAIIEGSREKRLKKIVSYIQKQKGQTLILVPEVAMLGAYGEFGTIYHAGLKQSEKKDIYKSVEAGGIHTIIGTQKSLFLPFQNLKTIVVDEEQYESYKLWDQYPRLHTVRGARELARIWGAQIVYASSYPSIALRYALAEGTCKALSNTPLSLTSDIIPYSFEDRKWKRALPNDAGTSIRAWARGGKKVLVLYNKKDNEKIREVLHFHLSKKAKENISFGTTSLLAGAMDTGYDRVVWVTPELTLKAIDYRSTERARILAARLQAITPKQRITIVARSAELAKQAFQASDAVWYEAVLKERRFLRLPPYTDLVRLTIRDKSGKKAQTRAQNIIELLGDALQVIPNAKALGPYQERGPKRSKLVEYHILLSGNIDELVPVYQSLPVDSADVDPHRIV